MKFSENWLRSWVAPEMYASSVMEKLTMSGLEVEARDVLAPRFTGVVVARVADVTQHPNADRLKVCRVAANRLWRAKRYPRQYCSLCLSRRTSR